MPGLIAFFTALPALLETLNRLGALAERLVKYTQEKNLDKWISDLEAGINALENARTPEEKISAGRSIVDSIRGL